MDEAERSIRCRETRSAATYDSTRHCLESVVSNFSRDPSTELQHSCAWRDWLPFRSLRVSDKYLQAEPPQTDPDHLLSSRFPDVLPPFRGRHQMRVLERDLLVATRSDDVIEVIAAACTIAFELWPEPVGRVLAVIVA